MTEKLESIAAQVLDLHKEHYTLNWELLENDHYEGIAFPEESDRKIYQMQQLIKATLLERNLIQYVDGTTTKTRLTNAGYAKLAIDDL